MHANRSIVFAVSVALAVAGCATASKDIASAYVSPNQYSTYDCEQLAAETARIQARVVQTGGRLDEAAQNDAGIMAVGLILFWPVLFALGGTKQQEAEYARLKGEYDAVEQAAIAKKCAHVVQSAKVTTPNSGAPASSASGSVPNPPTAGTVTAPTSASSPPAAAPPTTRNGVPAPGASTSGSAPPIAIAPAAGALPVTSKYMFNAERLAKDSGCASPVATMNIRASTYETFTVTCASGDPRLIRCDDGVCRELK
jgi:hypothetical protein